MDNTENLKQTEQPSTDNQAVAPPADEGATNNQSASNPPEPPKENPQEEEKQEPKAPPADKTDTEDKPEQPDESAELKAANERAEAAEAKALVLGMGVKAEAVGDVIALAKTRVNKDTPLEKAVEDVLTTYGEFKSVPAITTGTKTTGDTQDNNAEARKVMGLPSKQTD